MITITLLHKSDKVCERSTDIIFHNKNFTKLNKINPKFLQLTHQKSCRR